MEEVENNSAEQMLLLQNELQQHAARNAHLETAYRRCEPQLVGLVC